MDKVSMQAIGEQVVTFVAADGAQEGAVCKVTANGTVGPCAAGEAFCGLCGKVRGGTAAVVLGGYVELPYSGTAPGVGYASLTADGDGGVKSAGSGDQGRQALVVMVDTTDKLVGLFL